jgi:uncharacterized membrane protein
LNFKEIKKGALAALEGRWGFAILLSLITLAFTEFIPKLIEMLLSLNSPEWKNESKSPIQAVITGDIVAFVLAPFLYSSYFVFLDLLRKKEVKISNLFDPIKTKFYGKMLGLYFVYILRVFLWTLLLIIPGVIKSISYSQAFFILKDNPEIGIGEAIKRSREMMDGHKGEYFLFGMSFIGWVILGVLTIGIGLLWVIPYMSISFANYYEILKETVRTVEVQGIEE